MRTKIVLGVGYVVIAALAFVLFTGARARAQERRDWPMHKVGEVNESAEWTMGRERIVVYKMVHDGCELYVASRGGGGGHSSDRPLSVATGRGCR